MEQRSKGRAASGKQRSEPLRKRALRGASGHAPDSVASGHPSDPVASGFSPTKKSPAGGGSSRRDPPGQLASPIPRLSEEHDGGSFEFPVGESLRIALQERFEPGLIWHIQTTNERVVALQEVSLAPHQQRGRGSGMATRSWIFRGQAAGTADVTLRAVRKREGRRLIAREFTVHLTVRDA